MRWFDGLHYDKPCSDDFRSEIWSALTSFVQYAESWKFVTGSIPLQSILERLEYVYRHYDEKQNPNAYWLHAPNYWNNRPENMDLMSSNSDPSSNMYSYLILLRHTGGSIPWFQATQDLTVEQEIAVLTLVSNHFTTIDEERMIEQFSMKTRGLANDGPNTEGLKGIKNNLITISEAMDNEDLLLTAIHALDPLIYNPVCNDGSGILLSGFIRSFLFDMAKGHGNKTNTLTVYATIVEQSMLYIDGLSCSVQDKERFMSAFLMSDAWKYDYYERITDPIDVVIQNARCGDYVLDAKQR
jgi:hypothetical protein